MTYRFKGFEFIKNGNSILPEADRPTKECWAAYHDFILLPKREQEACRVV